MERASRVAASRYVTVDQEWPAEQMAMSWFGKKVCALAKDRLLGNQALPHIPSLSPGWVNSLTAISSPTSLNHYQCNFNTNFNTSPSAVRSYIIFPIRGQAKCFITFHQLTLPVLTSGGFVLFLQGSDRMLLTHGTKALSAAGTRHRVGVKLPALQAVNGLGSDTLMMWVVEMRLQHHLTV